jgi:hypothetical protein
MINGSAWLNLLIPHRQYFRIAIHFVPIVSICWRTPWDDAGAIDVSDAAAAGGQHRKPI